MKRHASIPHGQSIGICESMVTCSTKYEQIIMKEDQPIINKIFMMIIDLKIMFTTNGKNWSFRMVFTKSLCLRVRKRQIEKG